MAYAGGWDCELCSRCATACFPMCVAVKLRDINRNGVGARELQGLCDTGDALAWCLAAVDG